MTDVSVVMPARDELAAWSMPEELIIVVDSDDDLTPPPRVVQDGTGPASAIRYGIARATGDVIIVMCHDGSDDPAVIPQMTALVRRGYTVVCADRYMTGGHRIGGPKIKGAMSRLANRALGVDATNLYKAYDGAWLRRQVIESEHGFTIGLEMVAKARREGLPVTRVPVTWRDRTEGESHWRWSWLPSYVRWWAAARMALATPSVMREQSSAPPKSRSRRQGKAPARPTGGAS